MGSNGELRYGISALGLEYREQAENDELLVDIPTGKMHYKRSDGQIVTSDNCTYPTEMLGIAMKSAAKNAGKHIIANENHFVAYHTIDISQKTDLLSDEASSAYNKFILLM